MIIKKASVSEITVIAEIEKECFSSPWSENSVRDSFNNKSNYFYIAEADGKTVGYIGLSISLNEAYILNIAVLPAYRRQGTARALLTHVINIYEDELSFLTLEVRPSNTAALKLYEGFGFKQVGERKDYYRNPAENALLLTKYFNNKENV